MKMVFTKDCKYENCIKFDSGFFKKGLNFFLEYLVEGMALSKECVYELGRLAWKEVKEGQSVVLDMEEVRNEDRHLFFYLLTNYVLLPRIKEYLVDKETAKKFENWQIKVMVEKDLKEDFFSAGTVEVKNGELVVKYGGEEFIVEKGKWYE